MLWLPFFDRAIGTCVSFHPRVREEAASGPEPKYPVWALNNGTGYVVGSKGRPFHQLFFGGTSPFC